MSLFVPKGADCLVFTAAGIDEKTAVLAENNSLGLKSGSTVTVCCGGQSITCKVKLDTRDDIADTDKDNVILSLNLRSLNGKAGVYLKGSALRYKMKQAFGSAKARASMLGTLVTIGAAFGTALRASSGCSAGTPKPFDVITWALFGLATAGAFFSWYKDNLA